MSWYILLFLSRFSLSGADSSIQLCKVGAGRYRLSDGDANVNGPPSYTSFSLRSA